MVLEIKINGRYDTEHDTLIIDIPYAAKAIGTMSVNTNTIVDVDADGKITSIEIMHFTRFKKKPNDNPGTN